MRGRASLGEKRVLFNVYSWGANAVNVFLLERLLAIGFKWASLLNNETQGGF